MATPTNRAIALLDDFAGAVPPCDEYLHSPQIWRKDDSGEWVEAPNADSDIYSALFKFSCQHQANTGKPAGSAFIARTTGYGAPLGKDGQVGDVPPSEHPERVRISLDICSSVSGHVASRMTFTSGPKSGEFLDDTGEATGDLAEAIDLCSVRVWGERFTTALLDTYAKIRATAPKAELLALALRVQKILNAIEDEGDEE